MKFEIRYPTGSTHRVDYAGTLVTLGRDPSCDIVLSDSKCSRRHGVIESGPDGLMVRDTGSANGVFVNGSKVERATLHDGDLVRMGEVIIKVIGEELAGTVVVASDELEPFAPPPPAARSHASLTTTEIAGLPAGGTPRAGPPPQQVKSSPSPVGVPRIEGAHRAEAPPRSPAPAAPRAEPARPASVDLQGPLPRPLTISVLAVLWALSAVAFVASGLAAAAALWENRLPALAVAALGLFLAVVGAALAVGLWTRSPWARPLQIVLAGLGILACPFLPAAVTTLIYMLRAEVRAAFSGKKDLSELLPAEAEALRAGAAETAFSLSLLAMVLLGVVVTAVLAWFGTRTRVA